MSTLTDQAADNDILLKEGPAMDALTVLRANKRFPLTNRLERSLRIPFFANGQQTHDARVADG